VGDLGAAASPVRRETMVVNKQGWHARPSAMVVKCANAFKAEVTIEINGQIANARSMMDVIMLASPCGSVVRIETSGPDAEPCAEALVKLISEGFGEELA
jgi:phosphocarrier protein HPr